MRRGDEALALAKGAATCFPFAYRLFGQRHMSLGGATAEYFYGVWFKHLSLLNEAVRCGVPSVVVELGPGDSIGVGVAALLSGATAYVGVDARPFAASGNSEAIASDLIRLFQSRAPFHPAGWPEFRQLLDERSFPSGILTESRLASSLAPARIDAINVAVRRMFSAGDGAMIAYRAPISDPLVVSPNSVDLVLSHSVLEHVVDLRETISNAYTWLRPGGYMSHQFDLDSHGIVRLWDGHRAFGERTWRIVVGSRPFMINRLPYSAVLRIIEDSGFCVLKEARYRERPTLHRSQLCKSWGTLSDEELLTRGGYIVAQKPLHA